MENKQKGKLLLLKLKGRTFSLLIRDNRILAIQADEEKSSRIGNIYVGKVQNVSANIGAAFVELSKGELSFLPLQEAKNAFLTNRKADGTLKAGDELLVQVVKEPLKTKLTGVSSRLSLAGSYVVIEYRDSCKAVKPQEQGKSGKRTDNNNIRISSKLGTRYHHLFHEQEALWEIAETFYVTIRTNAGSVEDVSIVIAEAQALAAQMNHILAVGNKRVCFSCLHQSEPEYLSFIKNAYQSEYDEIVTDEKELYEALLADEKTGNLPIRFYEDSLLPLYKLYSVETRIKELLNQKVWLKSGGYLVIEQTEALVAIDVNTGKYEAGKKQEETYLKINLEAAEAIAWSLRARNLSGMILVDFINMKKKEHMEQLIQTMKKYLRKDPVPTYVVDITGLGLMEITRKKQSKSFAEQMQKMHAGSK